MAETKRFAVRFSLAWLCSFVFLLGIYAAAASIPCAHHDQYRYFAPSGPDAKRVKRIRTCDPQWAWLRLIGRPVAAELEHQAFKRVQTVGDFTRVRIVGIALYATAMALLVCYLLELKLAAGVAFCLAGAVFALPGVQFSVYMASLNHPVAHILALSAGLLMRLGSRLSAGDRRWYWNLARINCHAAAIALLVVAQLSYAASAFVVLFLIGAELAFKGTADWRATRRHLIRDAFLLGVACIIYYLIVKRYYVSHGGHGNTNYQIVLNWRLADRLRSARNELLLPTLNLWNVHVRPRVAYAVGGFLFSGLAVMLPRQLWYARRNPRRMARAVWDGTLVRTSVQCTVPVQRLGRGLQFVGAAAIVVLLSETTYLAAPTGWPLYRTHFASAGVTLLLLAGAAAAWGRVVAIRWRAKAASVVAAGTLCVAGFVAHDNVMMNCLNDSLELSFISSQISSHVGETIRRIHLIEPTDSLVAFNGRAVVHNGDEFNTPTTSAHVSTLSAVQTALQGVFDRDTLLTYDIPHTIEGIRSINDYSIAITRSLAGQPVIPSPDMIIIDMDALLRVATPAKRPWRAPGPLVTAGAAGPPMR